MTTYTDAFGSDTIPPSGLAFAAYSFTANATLVWPFNTVGTTNYVAAIMEITTTAGLTVSFPPANQASTGQNVLVRNIGANSFTVKDGAGNTIATVASGEAKFFYIKNNSTVAGVWAILTYGTGSSTADAATLQGLGLITIGATLNENHPTVTISSTPTSQSLTERGKSIIFTGGATQYDLLAAATATDGFMSYLRNAGSGTVTIDPSGGELIDGQSNFSLQPSESLLLVCTGATWYTVGYGRSAEFTYSRLVKPVTPSVDITLSASEISNQFIALTGTLTANINLIFPAVLGVYYVACEWTGAFSVTAKTAAGVGVALGTGQNAVLTCDGSDIDQSGALPNTVAITSGTINGVVIGGITPAAGTFTTLNANGGGALTGTWTNLGSVTTIDINGGTVDGAIVGGTTPAAGTFTNSTANAFIPVTTGVVPTNGLYSSSTDSIHFATNSVARIQIDSVGRLAGFALHNNASSPTGTANQYIASGTYTPTLTNTTNISSSNANVFQWLRVGNVVTVSGLVGIDPTAGSTSTRLTLSIPLASDFSIPTQCCGNGNSAGLGTTTMFGAISGDIGANAAQYDFTSDSGAGNISHALNFTYLLV